MRILRHKRHLLRDRAQACPTYGGWTTEEPTQLSPARTTTCLGMSGCPRR